MCYTKDNETFAEIRESEGIDYDANEKSQTLSGSILCCGAEHGESGSNAGFGSSGEQSYQQRDL